MEVGPGPSHNFVSALLPEHDSCWSFRSRFEKLLFVGIVFVLVIAGIFVTFIAVFSTRIANSNKGNLNDYNVLDNPILAVAPALHYSNAQDDDHDLHNDNSINQNASNSWNPVCLSSSCVKSAAELINFLDESVPPCDDFYHFVCGGWISSSNIPEDQGITSMFEESRRKLDITLKDLVERSPESHQFPPNQESNDTRSIVNVKNIYKSCMNLASIEQYNIRPLQEALVRLGGWPVIEGDQWNGYAFDWIRTMANMRQMGYKVNMFLNLKIIGDVIDNKKNILYIGEPQLGLRKQILDEGLNNSIVASYHKMLVESAMMLGAGNRIRVEQEMLEVIQIERHLANFMVNQNLLDSKRTYYFNVSAFMSMSRHPQVIANNQTRIGDKWLDFLNAVLQLKESRITEKEVVITDNVQIIEIVDILLSWLEIHDPRTMANYMLSKVVLQSLVSGNKMMREIGNHMTELLYGVTERPPRWKFCLNQLTGSLSIALSSLYVKNNFNQKSKKEVSMMVNLIKNEFTSMLQELDWMDETTRKNALKKAHAIYSVIGYPDELLNDTLIDEYYKELSMIPDNFEVNYRRLVKWASDIKYNRLHQPNNPRDWKVYAESIASVNAFYQPQANSIVIPAGILRDSFYEDERPQYLNFGTIGFIIGHEITHAFDNVGSRYDEEGNGKYWWRNETYLQYQDKTKCMVRQYFNYTLKSGLKINGNYTLRENIADNGAIKEAYKAYSKYVEQYGHELPLPALKYTTKQLFWIAAAKNWCSKSTPQMSKTKIDIDGHSPAQARVNVVLSNIAQFAQDFQCPAGSNMNPLERCTIW